MPEKLERFSPDKLNEILEVTRVDVGNGTLFGTALKRPANDTRLTLVISTGGSGLTSIKEAIRIADQRLVPDYTNYVKFLVIDSDTGEVENIGKNSQVLTLNLSTPGAKDRMILKSRSKFHRQFMHPQYDIALINGDGSSQDRTTGKMKLYDQDKSGGSTNDLVLESRISGLFDGPWNAYRTKEVDIFILSGLSGGNGSGTFLDIAAHAKKACPNPALVKVYGFLMLPDTAERFASNQKAKQSLFANGFAALKELESYMSLSFEPEREEVFYSSDGTSIRFDAANALYDYPILLSGDYDQAVSMVAETIVNMIANNAGGFGMSSFYSNTGVAKMNILNNFGSQGYLTEGEYPEDSHAYCGIGYATASIPEKVVIPNAVSRICRRLYISPRDLHIPGNNSEVAWCASDRHLSRVDYTDALKKLLSIEDENFDGNSLWKKLEGMISAEVVFEENPYGVTWNDIVSGQTKDFIDAYHVGNVTEKGIRSLQGQLQDMFRTFQEQAKAVMKQYGPYVIGHLYSGEGDRDSEGNEISMKGICLKTQMENVLTQLSVLAQKPGQYPPTGDPKSWIGGLFEHFSKKDASAWIGEVDAAARDDVVCGIAKDLKGELGTFAREYVDRIDDFIHCCMRFADVLKGMTDFYKASGTSLDAESYEQFAANAGDVNSVNLCSNSQMYEWVKNEVNEKVNGIDLDDVKGALVDDFYRHRADWISGAKGVARKRYDEVMSTVCAIGSHATHDNGLNLSIVDYFEEVLEEVPNPAQQQDTVNANVKTIVDRLMVKSKPSLKTRSLVQNQGAAIINTTIMLPNSLRANAYGTLIDNAFQQEVRRTLGNAQVVYSDVVDSIVCYQTSVGNALCDIAQLDLWENAYDHQSSNSIHLVNGEYETQYTEVDKRTRDHQLGISDETLSEEDNLLATTGLSFLHYPSVNLRRYGDSFTAFTGDGTAATTEALYRSSVFAKKIDYALKEKLIECVRTGNTYRYYLNVIPDDWTNLSVEGSEDSLEKGEALFKYLKAQNSHSGSVCRKQIMLTGSPYFGENGFDFTNVLNLQKGLWSQERIDGLHRAYMMRIMRKSVDLYRQLEKTIYRYYDIRVAIDSVMAKQEAKRCAKLFGDLFICGVIRTDEKQASWKAQINVTGGLKDVLTFTYRSMMTLPDLDKTLIRDGLRLVPVLNSFMQKLKTGEITAAALETVKGRVIEKMSDAELDETVGKNAAILQTYLDKFQEICDASINPDDKEGAVMEKYELKPTEANFSIAENIAQYFSGLKAAVDEATSLGGFLF